MTPFAPTPPADFLQKRIPQSGVVTLPPEIYQTAKPILLANCHDLTVFAYGVTLQSDARQPTTADLSDTLRLVNCHRVRFLGLTIDGNAAARGKPQPADSSQASLGIWGGSDVIVEDFTFAGAICDDVFICSSTGVSCTDPASIPQWVTLRHNKHLGPAYRQQVSIVHGRHVRVEESAFRDQTATYTGTSIDIESNPGDVSGALADISVTGCDFVNCNLGVSINPTANPSGVEVVDNRFYGGVKGILCGVAKSILAQNRMVNLKGIGITANAPCLIDANRFTDCQDCPIYSGEDKDHGISGGASTVSNNTAVDCISSNPSVNPAVFQLRYGGGNGVVTGNTAYLTVPRKDLAGFLIETGTAKASGNVCVNCN